MELFPPEKSPRTRIAIPTRVHQKYKHNVIPLSKENSVHWRQSNSNYVTSKNMHVLRL